MILFSGCPETAETETTRAAFAWTGVAEEKLPVLEKYGINTLYIDYQSYENVPEGITYEEDVAAALESYGKLEGVGLALHWLNYME